MKITKLRICTGIDRNDFVYFSKAIEHDRKYYYRVDYITIEITKPEYDLVSRNPNLYYFSTELKLHFRIKKKRELINLTDYLLI